ncbi:hypothetical protein MKZ38_002184 [Zalerion maritima]|uniref:Uncharacterized protein n=1 Tax=Zalerion maritima TaxID=339359 RepID=A0AAD5WTB9_9PEZI|nr:hypothetical protein MKZ38_002184 [Zalerion maritima]
MNGSVRQPVKMGNVGAERKCMGREVGKSVTLHESVRGRIFHFQVPSWGLGLGTYKERIVLAVTSDEFGEKPNNKASCPVWAQPPLDLTTGPSV